MYNVESVLLFSYVVWRSNLLIHTRLFNGFIFLEVFVTPTYIAMGIKLGVDVWPHIIIRLHT